MKYFRMSYEEVVFKRSYINIILLNRSIPSFDFDKESMEDDVEESTKKKPKKQTYNNANDLFMSLM